VASITRFDLDYPQLLLVVFALCVSAALLAVAGTSSASFGAYNADWNGASGLDGEASAVGVDAQPIRETAAYGDVPANGTIAVVLAPDDPYGPDAVGRLDRFVREGGTLLVAGDYGPYANALLADLGVNARLDGRTLRDERYYYRSPALPIARNVSEHRYTRDVSQLTLNHGTAVQRTESGGPNASNRSRVLVNSSAFAYLDGDSNGRLDGGEELGRYPVAVVEPMGEGRVVVVSDPSVFINAMLDRPENREFVRTLFGAHERVLLDGSHTAGVPPLALAVLVIRDSPFLQVLLGTGALGFIGLLARRPSPIGRARSRLERRNEGNGRSAGIARSGEVRETGVEIESTDIGPEAIEAYLVERHPDWDRERVRRVIRGIKNYRFNDRKDD
jgi:hypothetical protein